MIYILAALLPPLGLLLNGQPFAAVFNLVLIPRYGPDGAAFDALLSSFLLAVLAIWQAKVVIGRADLVGAFGGPFLGGCAMAAIVLLAPLPWWVEAPLGLIAYAATLCAFEWIMRRDDARLYLRALPLPLASRSRTGRTAA